jgi:YD repeat-containing protein
MLVASQLALGVPVAAASPASPAAAQEPPPPEPQVTPNRTVPNVMPPATELTLPAVPTDEELTRARIFSEPLVPMPWGTSPEENAALARAILIYRDTRQSEKVAPLLAFLQRFPQSAWRPSLLANFGTVYRANGYLSRALRAWEQAWDGAKIETDLRAKAVADFALGEFLDLSGKVGHERQIAARLDEIEGRNVTGRAAQKVAMAREALWVFRFHHEEAAPSGPAALESILAYTAYENHTRHTPNPLLQRYHATPDGTTLSDLKALARNVGLSYEMVLRPGDVEIPIPSVVHLKVEHYSAIVKQDGNRYLLLDPILGGEKWVTREALNEEGSGYFLAARSAVTADWTIISAAEAATVVGHCAPGGPDDDDPCPNCGAGGGGGGGGAGPSGPPPSVGCGIGGCDKGMPQYSLLRMPASLRLSDLPVSYSQAVGPAVNFRLTYNQRDGSQPQTFAIGNVGPKWTFDWLSYVTDDPTLSSDIQASVHLRGGGVEQFRGGAGTGVYDAYWRSRAVLAKVSTNPIRYERRLRDGGLEVFAQSDGVITSGRRVYLTDVIDPQGLSIHLTYDASMRMVAVTDATGFVTTLSYELTSDPLKITKVTDPLGRSATLSYNAAGELASITDVIGLTSSFAYSSNDFISGLTTPYGTTLFSHESGLDTNSFRFIQVTDPLGDTERVEFRWSTTAIPATAPAAEVPSGFSAYNTNLDHYNSLYWDKRAMALYPGDVSKATITHWLMYLYQSYVPFYYAHAFSTSVPHSIKRPLENRVWYAYPDQDASMGYVGSWTAPTKTARVLDDGTSQIWQAAYNSMGNATQQTDPLGRQQTFAYAANGIDLVEVRQTTETLNDLLASFANYTPQHLLQTMTDAAGQASTATYNASGQVLTRTNAKNETTTFAYNTSGFLASVTGPIAGSTTTYTYDGYGRVRTVTDADGYAVITDYDAFDRPTRVTYPDGTTESITYDKLDVAARTDRLGRVTRVFHDRLRRVVATRDPQGRTVTQQWCKCGSLDQLIDANGHATTWERDAQGRVIREVRADGTTATLYTYESTTSRIKTVTDPKGQVTTYVYNGDDTIREVIFTNATIATPSVTYTYDPSYNRMVGMADGTGTTAYNYHAPGTLGAGRVASVDGPLLNDTITYGYDELGRATSRAINGVGVTWTFDAIGRTTQEVNALGTFTYAYEAVTARLASVTYPNGQSSAYSYFENVGDHRLQTIHHKYPNGSTLAKFDYTYDAVGNIRTWRQQADQTAVVWTYGYDAADQLTSAVKKNDPQATVLQRYAYGYDPAGNRSSEQIDDAVTTASYDALNRLTAQQAGGAIMVQGTVNEPAAVTIAGKPATVDASNTFRGQATVASGTTTVAIAARDGSGNQNTATYEIDQASGGKTFTYDANGNVTSDGTRTFEWDARNQLVAVNVGTHRSEFTYDGEQHRVRIVEKEMA